MAAGTGRDSAAVERDHGAAAVTGGSAGRAWLAALPDELAAQRRVLAGLIEYSENTPLVSLLLVGCSLGRGAADALSEIDAAMAVCAESGGADAEQVRAAEAALVAALPSLGTNLASDGAASPYAVTGEQVREWAFRGWCALIDADKYLCRGSLWEAHNRLHAARKHIWALWAAATGALYPWHGLSQVLDNDPRSLPPGIEATVAGLDQADLRRAVCASAEVLTAVSASAAQRCQADLPSAMADYVTRVVAHGR